VYEEGGTNIWKQLAPKTAIAAAGLIFGIWAFPESKPYPPSF